MAIGWMILGLFYLGSAVYSMVYTPAGKSTANTALSLTEVGTGLLWVYAAYTEGPLLAYVIIISGFLRLGVGILGVVAGQESGVTIFSYLSIIPIVVGVIFLFLGFRRLRAPAVIGGRRR